MPGSIYASEGLLRIKYKDKLTGQTKIKTTGLYDTPGGRMMALEILENMWMESMGLRQPKDASEVPKTISSAWNKYFTSKRPTLSPVTLKYYDYAYKSVFVRDAPLSAESFEKFVALFLAKTHTGNVTVNNVLRAIQIFINFCVKKKWLTESIDIASENKRKVKSIIDPFTDDEINKLINFWKEANPELAIFIEVMWLTGARLGDMLNMRPTDILDDKQIIVWYNKIDKEPEPVPTATRVFEILPRNRADGRIWRWSPATKSRLSQYMRDALYELDIEQRGRSWHEVRKNFCTKVGRMNLPVKDFLTLVRHKSLDTTIQKYLAPDDAIQHEAVKQLNIATNERTKYVPKLKIN